MGMKGQSRMTSRMRIETVRETEGRLFDFLTHARLYSPHLIILAVYNFLSMYPSRRFAFYHYPAKHMATITLFH